MTDSEFERMYEWGDLMTRSERIGERIERAYQERRVTLHPVWKEFAELLAEELFLEIEEDLAQVKKVLTLMLPKIEKIERIATDPPAHGPNGGFYPSERFCAGCYCGNCQEHGRR